MAKQLTVGQLIKYLEILPANTKLFIETSNSIRPINCLSDAGNGISFCDAYHTEEYQPLGWTLATIAKYHQEIDKETIKERINNLMKLL